MPSRSAHAANRKQEKISRRWMLGTAARGSGRGRGSSRGRGRGRARGRADAAELDEPPPEDDLNESEEEESVPEASSNESGGSDFSRAKEASGGRGRGRRGGGRGRGRSRGGVEPTEVSSTRGSGRRGRGRRGGPAGEGQGVSSRGRTSGRARGRSRGSGRLASKIGTWVHHTAINGFSQGLNDLDEDTDTEDANAQSEGQIEKPDPIPASVSLQRAAEGSEALQIPSESLGEAMSAYMTLRAFSWQICLSPVFFEELCAALNSGQPTPLADEIFVSVLRGLAYDENREARARRTLELSSLDHVTWPEYVWEWLRLSNNPLSKLRSLGARQSAAQTGEAASEEIAQAGTGMNSIKGSHESSPSPSSASQEKGSSQKEELSKAETKYAATVKELIKRPKFQRKLQSEFYALSFEVKAKILAAMCNDLLSITPIRLEIERREDSEQLIAGLRGEGGVMPMRTLEERAQRQAPGENPSDTNTDTCVLCNCAGSLLCCDGCPAAYHMRCIGESGRSLPEGEWLCPECALGGRGESGGVRVPLAGFNASGQQHHIIQGTLLRTGKPPHKGRGRRYRETNPPVFMHRGTEALERIEALEYASDYEDDGYVLSSVDAIEEEPRKDIPLVAAETYLNRYKNGWIASVLASKQFYDDCTKRKGRVSYKGESVHYTDLPVPVPISRFPWPQSQGKGNSRGIEKCGVCRHCLKPNLRKACLNPIPKVTDEAEGASGAKVAAPVNYMLRVEREWSIMMEGEWAGNSHQHRKQWAEKVRGTESADELVGSLLQMEAAMRPIVFSPTWDPGLASRDLQSKPAAGSTDALVKLQPVRRRDRGPRPPMRWTDPDELFGRGRGRNKAKSKIRKKLLAVDTDDESEGGDPVQDAEALVDDETTKRFTYWCVSYRRRWDRWQGRHSLPQRAAKRAARKSGCVQIPGVVYSTDHPATVPRLAWQAGCEAAHTAAELAMQIRTFDSQLQWDGTKPPAVNHVMAHVVLLDKRESQSDPGWEYLMQVPAMMKGRDAGKTRQKGSASVPNVSFSRFAPPSLQKQEQAFPSTYLTPAAATLPAAKVETIKPSSQLTRLPARIPETAQSSMPAVTPPIPNQSSATLPTGKKQGQQGIFVRLAEAVRSPLQSQALDTAAQQPIISSLGAASPTGQAHVADKPAELEAVLDAKPAVLNAYESANGFAEEEVGKKDEAELADALPADQPAAPLEGPTGQAAPTSDHHHTVEHSPKSVAEDSVAEQTEAAEAPANTTSSAAKKWTGFREAKSLVTAIQESAGLQLTGGRSELGDQSNQPSTRSKLRSSLPGPSPAITSDTTPATGPARSKPSTTAGSSPLEVVRRLAGQAPGWVHESQMPLWLIRNYEEKSKRVTAEQSAVAVQQAIRDALWDAQMAAEQKKLDAIKQETLNKAASCAECGLAAGADSGKDKLWISCDVCHNWYHGSCAELTQEMLDLAAENDFWECQNCWLTRTEPKRLAVARQMDQEDTEEQQPQTDQRGKEDGKKRKPAGKGKGMANRKDQEEEEKLYCICKQPWEEGQEMVACESCPDWFHPDCLGSTMEELEDTDFICPNCQKKDLKEPSAAAGPVSRGVLNQLRAERPQMSGVKADKPSKRFAKPSSSTGKNSGLSSGRNGTRSTAEQPSLQTVAPGSWQAAAVQALDSVLAGPVMKPFISRVTEKIAPGYTEVITHPMDLTTVRSKLERPGGYTSAEDAKADIALVWKNCRTYNEPPHKVLDMCDKAEALVKAAWEIEGVDKLERAKPSKKRKAFNVNSGTKAPDLQGDEALPSSDSKRLKITIRSNQGRNQKPSTIEELSIALEVVQELAKSEAGQPFAEAVTIFDAPDYSKWVKKPMDLGLIASKLQDKKYVSIDEVLQDVELVWSNCRLYNTSEGSEILVLLDRAERLFQSLWQKAGLSLKAEGQTGSAGRAPQEETEKLQHLSRDLKIDPAASRGPAGAELSKSKGKRGRPKVKIRGQAEAASKGAALQDQADGKKKRKTSEMEVDDSEGLQPIQADSAREDAAASKASQGSRMNKKTAATVIRVLKQVGRTPAGSHFKQPVPVDTIPGYLEVVKKPMDFSTVASHVREDAYSSLGEVVADVKLIWTNCKAFNEGDPIVEDCKAAEQSFQEGWLLAGLPADALSGQSQVAGQDSKQAETGPPKALKVKLKTAASKQGDILTEGAVKGSGHAANSKAEHEKDRDLVNKGETSDADNIAKSGLKAKLKIGKGSLDKGKASQSTADQNKGRQSKASGQGSAKSDKKPSGRPPKAKSQLESIPSLPAAEQDKQKDTAADTKQLPKQTRDAAGSKDGGRSAGRLEKENKQASVAGRESATTGQKKIGPKGRGKPGKQDSGRESENQQDAQQTSKAAKASDSAGRVKIKTKGPSAQKRRKL